MPLIAAVIATLAMTIVFLIHRIDAMSYTAIVTAALLLGAALTKVELYVRFASRKASMAAFFIGALLFALALASSGAIAVVLLVFAGASMAFSQLLLYLSR